MKSRKDKLVALREFIDLETGEVYEDKFDWENILYEKAVKKKSLDAKIFKCNRCDDLNIVRYSESASGWGNLNSPYFFIGQSLHKFGVSSGVPFIKGSGYAIDAALRVIGLTRWDVYLTNVVLCHPPNNRSSSMQEKENCLPFLKQQLDIVKPEMVICLGSDAAWAIQRLRMKSNKRQKIVKMRHPASFCYSAPEARVEFIIKLATELEKILG